MEIPAEVESRIARGGRRLDEISPDRIRAFAYLRGHHYVRRGVNSGRLIVKATETRVAGGKPPHRVRAARNLLLDIVANEVSAASLRVPGYEVVPSTTDPEDRGSAKLGERVLLYGYDAWKVRQASRKTVTHAVVGDEGFAWPYYDERKREICIMVYGGTEVMWEPGVRFEDSRWHAVRQARQIEDVKAMAGFIKGTKLTADAAATGPETERQRVAQPGSLVLVTEYLERPSEKHPKGRRLVIANGQIIVDPEGEDYPLVDVHGNPLDEPVLHKLSYFTDPDSDRDMGLVRHLLDPMDNFNDTVSRILEWARYTLTPQLLAPRGSRVRPTSEPGEITWYDPVFGLEPKWRQVPQIPPELFTMLEQTRADMRQIAGQNLEAVSVETAREAEALQNVDRRRREDFLQQYAEWHTGIARHGLILAQLHYDAPRLLTLRGRFGPELVRDFRGADLRGQTDVRINPDSLAPRSRADIEKRVMAFADRGWVSPQAAMAAIRGGTAEALLDDYERDVAWQNKEIQEIKALASPPQPSLRDRLTGRPPPEPQMPSAREFDNHAVHLEVLHSWMKTDDYDLAPAHVKEVADLHEKQHRYFQDAERVAAAQAQIETAQGLGMANAARPTTKGRPSMPSLQTNGAGNGQGAGEALFANRQAQESPPPGT